MSRLFIGGEVSAWKHLSAASCISHGQAIERKKHKRIEQRRKVASFPAGATADADDILESSRRKGGTHLARALEALHCLLVGEATQAHTIHLQEPVTCKGGMPVTSWASAAARRDPGRSNRKQSCQDTTQGPLGTYSLPSSEIHIRLMP